MKANIDKDTQNTQKSLRDNVEENSNVIADIVNTIIQPYCKDLDKYVEFIHSCLHDGERPPTTCELEDFCLNLAAYIYFASGLCEHLGIRDDISRALWKEMYNTHRDSIDKGTVADKNTLAELASQEEQLTNVCYSRAYKIMKNKVESAQELLASCKKVLSSRLASIELTHIDS